MIAVRRPRRIPFDLDPMAAIGLCLGLHFPGDSEEENQRALERAGAALEIPTFKLHQLGENLKGELAGSIPRSTTNHLEHPAEVEQVVSVMQRVLGHVTTLLQPDVAENLENALQPPVPTPILDVLFPVLAHRASRHPRRSYLPRVFCKALLRRDLACFRRAMAAFQAPHQGTDHDLDPLHVRSRILHHLKRSQEAPSDSEAGEAALLAWTLAFEDPIRDACRFVASLAIPAGRPVKPPAPELSPSRAAELRTFRAARDWCATNAVGFPFHPRLDEIYDAHRNSRYYIRNDSVEFRDRRGAVVDTLFISTLVRVANRDIGFAYEFTSGVYDAYVEARERSLQTRQAWAEAVGLVPALRTTKKKIRRRRMDVAKFDRRATSSPPPPQPQPPNPDILLAALLTNLFTHEELRIWAKSHYPWAREAVNHQVAPTIYAHDLLDAMRSRGELDSLFFRRLSDERPLRRRDVEAVEKLFLRWPAAPS